MSTTEAPAEPARDPLVLLGIAVVLLSLAGVAALLGEHLLLGWLRILAGVLAGIGVGVGLLAVPGRRIRPRAAGAVALVLGLALSVPFVLQHRPASIASVATTRMAPMAEEDALLAAPGPSEEGAVVLLARAEGPDQILDPVTGALTELPEEGETALLSADGLRVLRVREGTTRILDVRGAEVRELTQLPGTPISLDGELLVMEQERDDRCEMTGHDLAGDPAATTWTMVVPECGSMPASGVLPEATLRSDPRQGILQLDPATGFPWGRVLTQDPQACTATATTAPQEDQVVVVCSGQDGALTASAYHQGTLRWESDPSPGGDWSYRVDQGVVLATGTETGAQVEGELVVGAARAGWTAPGGDTMDAYDPPRARLGLDGRQMPLIHEGGPLVSYDTLTGESRWLVDLDEDGALATGAFDHGTSAVVDRAQRSAALAPRDGRRLRILDAEGETVRTLDLRETPGTIRPLPGGAILVEDAEELLLIRAR